MIIRLVSLLCLTFAAAAPALGALYQGTLQFVVTTTDDVRVSIGDTFSGWYRYDSPTVDGTFYGALGPFQTPPKPDLLDGAIEFTSGVAQGGHMGFDDFFWMATNLTVVGGQVTSFDWLFTYGPWNASGSNLTWSATDHVYNVIFNGAQGGHSAGVVHVTGPALVVHDQSAMPLVAVGILAIVMMHRSCTRKQPPHRRAWARTE